MIKQGISNFKHNLHLWPGLYATRLFLALVFTLPVFIVIGEPLSRSEYARALLKTWSIDVISEFFLTHENIFSTLLMVFVFYSLAMFLVKQFLNGGIYVSYLSPERTDLGDFFGEAAKLFRGNFRISLTMIPVYSILVLVGFFVADFLPSDLFGYYLEDRIVTGLFRFGVMFLFLIPGFLLSELLRFHLAAEPTEKAAASLRATLNLLKGKFVRLYALYLICFVPYLLVWIAIENLALVITGGLASGFGVLLELVLFQICALLHVGQSLLFTASVAPIVRKAYPGRFVEKVQGELKFD